MSSNNILSRWNLERPCNGREAEEYEQGADNEPRSSKYLDHAASLTTPKVLGLEQ